MNLPLVSLIVPVYNRQTSIEVCLKSVLNLEYTHFEVLVIDDGSTDDSLDIIRRVAATDTRIKVIVQKNSGVSVALIMDWMRLKVNGLVLLTRMTL